jgi:AraC family transcriptional regulator of adaptative response / DNA-3-methyladenine glycosylase II
MVARADSTLDAQAGVFARALDARDARFDGIFFVGITSTRIYCRPVCPARVAYHSHRRFFASAAAAEHAGFRPCLRCRPELAPGRAVVDAIPRIARAAEQRIAAGALNGRSVAELARDMGLSERHLRRALERSLGISPIKLAQTHRLLFAKRLLADTSLPVTQVAFASGFQSLRRFNAAFREQYRIAPSAIRRSPRTATGATATRAEPSQQFLRLTLAYRAPLAWDVLVSCLAGESIGGVETVTGRRYGRTIEIDGRTGVIFAEDAPDTTGQPGAAHVSIDVSSSLVPVLMPLLAKLRQLLDLDAEPLAIDSHLSQGGLAALVKTHPGVRIPGAIDGFDIALRAILRGRPRMTRADAMDAGGASSLDPAARVTWALGAPIDTGIAALSRLSPTAVQIADAGSARLEELGVSHGRAEAAIALARLMAEGSLRLDPGSDVAAASELLATIPGVGEQLTAMLVSRALRWPDVLPTSDKSLQRAGDVSSQGALLRLSQRWRPWRAYAALHLWLREDALVTQNLAATGRRASTTRTAIAS